MVKTALGKKMVENSRRYSGGCENVVLQTRHNTNSEVICVDHCWLTQEKPQLLCSLIVFSNTSIAFMGVNEHSLKPLVVVVSQSCLISRHVPIAYVLSLPTIYWSSRPIS